MMYDRRACMRVPKAIERYRIGERWRARDIVHAG
jgi:hypothetical protein